MSKVFGVKLIRFILIAFSASVAGVAILDVQDANYSCALTSIGVSLLLFIDALNPAFFLKSFGVKNLPVVNKSTVEPAGATPSADYKIYAMKFAWTLILIGIAAKLFAYLF